MTSTAGPVGLAGLLARWLPGQRWYSGKGTAGPPPRVVTSVPLPTDGPGEPTIHFVDVDGAYYQVPTTRYPAENRSLATALIGHADGDAQTAGWYYDGLHDPALITPWLAVLAGEATASSSSTQVRGLPVPGGVPVPTGAPGRVLTGEQSNTSVIIGDQLIVKLFRAVGVGDNPDVLTQTALAAAGCDRVARPASVLQAFWGDRHADLGYACEFLAGSQDAWREAIAAATRGESFAAQAHGLGVATAKVHAALAAALPTEPATPSTLATLADELLARLAWACDEVGELAGFRSAATRVLDGVRRLGEAPDRQRIHGDYHLGQVLHSPARGWILLDFEGEPLRPLHTRLAPDFALRDIAGMLRSFDYAAGYLAAEAGRPAPAGWVSGASVAFLDGYRDGGGRDPRRDSPLLAALELDKALYEVVYESRNRPAWVPIPVAAVARLLADQ